MAVGLEGKCGFKWQCRKNLEFSTSTCESGEEFHVILRVYVQGKKLFRGEAVRVGGGEGEGRDTLGALQRHPDGVVQSQLKISGLEAGRHTNWKCVFGNCSGHPVGRDLNIIQNFTPSHTTPPGPSHQCFPS